MKKQYFGTFCLTFLFGILASCGGSSGSTSSSTPNTNPNTNTSLISSTQQIHTPASISTKNSVADNKLREKTSLISTTPQINNSCFQLQNMGNQQNYKTVINSSEWWSTAQLVFSVKNTCSTGQGGDIDVVITGFKINNSPVTSSGEIAQTGSPWMTTTGLSTGNGNSVIHIVAPNCDGDYCSWAQVPPNGVNTYTVNTSLGSAITSATVDSIVIGGDTPPPPPPPPPPPVESGSIKLSLNGGNLNEICTSLKSCNITIVLNGSGLTSLQSFTYNPYNNLSQSITITNLNAGQYNFSVIESSLPNNTQYVISANPISVLASQTAQENIAFNYSKPQPSKYGNVVIALANINNVSDFNILKTITNMQINLTDATTGSTKYSTISMGGSVKFDNLLATDSYFVTIEGIGDPLQGIYYSLHNTPVSIVAGQTNNQTVNYTKVLSGLTSVAFNVAGLPAGSKPTVQFADVTANFKYQIDNLVSSNYTFIASDTVVATPSAVAGYRTPSVQTISSNVDSVDFIYTKGVVTAGTFDYIAPFKDYNNKVTLSVQGIATGKSLTFVSNFNPAAGWGNCFGGSYPSITTTSSGNKYTTTMTGTFNFNNTSCDVMGTNSGASIIMPGVTDPIVYSIIVDNQPLSMAQPCSATQCQDPGNGFANIGYYAEWSVWGRQYNPYNIPFNSINEVIFAFIGFDPATGNIKSLDASADSWGFSAITRATFQYPYLHAKLSFGGWTNNGITTAPMFMQLASSTTSMQNFANQSIALMRASNFDGIDIDWEWWSDYTNNQAPAKQSLAFFTILNQALSQASKQDGKQYTLTLAVNGGRDRVMALQDTTNNPNAISNYWAQVSKLVNSINIMSYDYHGGFEVSSAAYFQANYAFSNIPAGIMVGQDTGWSIQDSVNAYKNQGMAPSQLVVGIPLYARTMAVSSTTNGGLFQTITGTGYGDYEGGILDYKCLINPVNNPVTGCGSANPIAGIQSTVFYNIIATGSGLSLFNTYGKVAMQPWGFSAPTNTFVSYDDVWSATAKATYVTSNHLGGTMFWELDGDTTNPQTSIVQNVQKILAK